MPEPARRAMVRSRWAVRLVSALAGIAAVPAGAATVPIEGSFALPGVTAGVAGELVATPQGRPLDLKLDVMLHRPVEKNALKRYETLLGQQMIITVVSDDLMESIGRHVEHVIDGHGQVRVRFPQPGLYHVYVDAQPRTLPRQVERFDLPVGEAPPAASRPLPGPVAQASEGPYVLTFDSLDLPAGREVAVELHIASGDSPAKDLHPILGEPIEAVMISADDLTYIPLSVAGRGESAGESPLPDGSAIAPDLTLRLRAPRPGSYRLLLQFMGGRMTYTSQFVAVAR